MNAPAIKPIDSAKSYQVQVNQGFVSGRLKSKPQTMQTKDGRRFTQLLATPAVDAYSMPSVVELRSLSSLGQEGDDWSGPIKIGGYPNDYEITDKGTGEIKQVRSARIVLEVVES